MEDKEHLAVSIATDGEGIDLRLLNEFFYNFRSAYAAGVLNSINTQFPHFDQNYEDLSYWLKRSVNGSDWREISRLANVDLGNRNLEIVDIRRENPLLIVFAGSFVALTIAVILSGGKLQAGPLKVELPPLGDGIAKLRQAFGRSKPDDKSA